MHFVNLIQILKKNTLLLYLAAFIYSTFNCWYNHVWVGKDSKILKGVTIADNSIIGTSSVVTRSLTLSHSVYGGLPAQLLKTDVDWNREH